VRACHLVLLCLLLTGCASERGPREGMDTDGALMQERQTSWRRGTLFGSSTEANALRREGVVSGEGQNAPKVLIYPGATASPIAETGRRVALAGGSVELDLVDVDIKVAAKAVLGDILKVNYAIDPNVSGTVTVKTAGPVAARDTLGMFETALAQTNAAISVRNGAYTVVPSQTGSTDGATGITSATVGDQLGYNSRAVRLRHISAREMAEILKPYAKEGLTRIDAERNVLVLTGSGAQFEGWMDTIKTFDVDWLANKSVGVFQIENMPAAEMVRNLGEVMANANTDEQMIKFSTIDANNSVLAIARTRSALRNVKLWVSRLDAAGSSGMQIYTYDMRFARAQDVAPVLAGLLGASSMAPSADGAPGDVAQAGAKGMAPVSAQDPATPAAGVNEPAPGATDAPQSTLASDVMRFGSFAKFADRPSAGAGNRMRIVPNTQSNSLLIYGTRQQFDKVRDVLRTIDVPQRQVLVEATIVEVTLNDDLKYGVQYFLDRIINGTSITGALSNTNSPKPALGAPGFSLAVGLSSRAVIDALSGVTAINVISSPNVMVLNNETARLAVGDQVPIATQSRQDSLSRDPVTVNTIEFRDTGVIFDVTPRINSGGSVTLNILQEVSNVERQAQPTLTPTISQRKLRSSVTAANGETIILGGLFSNATTRTRAGLPGATRSGLLNAVLGSNASYSKKTELLVLIAPRIVSDRREARAVTDEMRARIKELQIDEPMRVKAPGR
jgi:general secretion pathway protein D